MGEKIADPDFFLCGSQWVSAKDLGRILSGSMIGAVLGKGFWPVIRRAAPKPAAPKVTMKDLLARIEALEKKVGGAKVTLTLGD